MALSDLQRLFVYYTATQLWQQDLLTNVYFQGSAVGANLRSMLLGQQPVKPLTNPFDEAMTGRLRADSAAMRQNARNVREASTMISLAGSTVATIKKVLEEMQTMAKQVQSGELLYDQDLATAYDALTDKIIRLVQGAQYNGISLLDKNKWGTDQISNTGSVYIQSLPNNGFELTFRDLGGLQWNKLRGADLENPGPLQTQVETLSTFIGDMNTQEEAYARRASGFKYQAIALESQAELLEQSVNARRHSPTKSLEEIILDLLLRQTGSLINKSG